MDEYVLNRSRFTCFRRFVERFRLALPSDIVVSLINAIDAFAEDFSDVQGQSFAQIFGEDSVKQLDNLFPVYFITCYHGRGHHHYAVHPDERDHMERWLAGTDDPIYDLVHELRYNPRLAIDPEIAAAKDRFYDVDTEK